jgi:hypothetical protein
LVLKKKEQSTLQIFSNGRGNWDKLQLVQGTLDKLQLVKGQPWDKLQLVKGTLRSVFFPSGEIQIIVEWGFGDENT